MWKVQITKIGFMERTPFKRNLYIRMGEATQRNSELSNLLSLTWGKYGNVSLAADFINQSVDVTKQQVQQFLSQYYVPDNFIFMTHKGQGK